jgi:predicted RNA methylase
MTAEGQYSITKPWDSDHIIKVMQDTVGDLKTKTIADLTGNVGGDTIRFGMNFKHVDSYELDKENYDALQNNVGLYDLKNVTIHHGDSTKLFDNNADVVYIDAPWGGPEYKEKTNMDLYLGTERIDELVKNFKGAVFLKVPNNYNFERFKDSHVTSIGKFKLISVKRNN